MKFKVIATSFVLLLSSGSVLAQIAECISVEVGMTPPTFTFRPYGPPIEGGMQPIFGFVDGMTCFLAGEEGTVFHRGVTAYCKINQSSREVPCGN